MHFKIWKKSQFELLKTMNPFLGKKKIPFEILCRVEQLLKLNNLGKEGYIAIIIQPIKDDVNDILEELNLDYNFIQIPDNNFYQIDVKGKKHPMKKRKWNSYDILLSENRGRIDVIYSMKWKVVKAMGE